MLNGSIGRCCINRCHSTFGPTLQRCKTLQRSGCGLTTITAKTWPWAGSHQSSDWPWLHNVSTSATLAKRENYHPAAFLHKNFTFGSLWLNCYNSTLLFLRECMLLYRFMDDSQLGEDLHGISLQTQQVTDLFIHHRLNGSWCFPTFLCSCDGELKRLFGAISA